MVGSTMLMFGAFLALIALATKEHVEGASCERRASCPSLLQGRSQLKTASKVADDSKVHDGSTSHFGPTNKGKQCRNFCARMRRKPWSEKCNIRPCKGCSECDSLDDSSTSATTTSPSPTTTSSSEDATDNTGQCEPNQIPHPDYPNVCVNSALAQAQVSCPATSAPTSSTPDYPHGLMTKNCPNAVLTTQCMSKDSYAAIVTSVTNIVNSLDDECTASTCEKADWAGCVLRMAGHDLMDFDPGTGKGGSDGCTDMNNADNKGLAPCLHAGEHGSSLLTVYEKTCESVSLADFLVIAAEAVMHATGGPDFQTSFKFGRTTTEECPDAAHKLPNPEEGCAAVQTTFLDNMGLDWRSATALMGVHTLGRARVENSGYSGWWSDPENSRKFNNNYYISLRNKGWEPMRAVCGNGNKNQWVKTGPGGLSTGDATEMMLDTDMCLAFHIERGAAAENCCAWLNRCHARGDNADGADDIGIVSWTTKLDAAGNNVSNPNGCWHFENDAVAARKTSRAELCGDAEVADCGMRNQEGKFKGTISGIGNQCTPRPDGSYHCRTSSSLSGIAHEYVTEFSADQEAWFTAFLSAWSHATTNGFSNLKALKDVCESA